LGDKHIKLRNREGFKKEKRKLMISRGGEKSHELKEKQRKTQLEKKKDPKRKQRN